MRPVPDEDVLITIGCDIAARPTNAPGVDDLARFIRSVDRTAGGIAVGIESGGRDILTAFVEAERQCCACIDWQIEDGPEPVLHIRADEETLAALDDLFQ
jgi:hypothetical protein